MDRKPRPGYEEIHQKKKELHLSRMKEQIEDDLETLNLSQFHAALKKVSVKHNEKYKFILNAGNSLMNAIFRLFSLVWESENIPDSWIDSLLIQLYKGRGSKSNFDNSRFIHLKEDPLPKLFSQIVLSNILQMVAQQLSP